MVPLESRRERIDHDLLRRYRDGGDLHAREELAERCLPLVRSVARRYAGRGQGMDDLMQAGLLGLAKAIERFDAGPGCRFSTYAVPNIQGEIRRYFRDGTWAVHVPRSVQELDARVQHASARMRERTGREASTRDLAQALDVGIEDVRHAQAARRNHRALSLDHPAGPGVALGRAGGTDDPGFERVENVDVIERAMEGLEDRDRLIVWWRFRDGLLQREIAERIGVSQMQVSRILRRALRQMGAQGADPRRGRTHRRAPAAAVVPGSVVATDGVMVPGA